MNNQGIGSWIARRAKITPWKTAIIAGRKNWTYAEFDREINRLAHGLRSLGIRRGDRIAYLNNNQPLYLQALFAAGTLGAIMVPLNFKLKPADLKYILNLSGCRLLIHDPATNETLEYLRSKTPDMHFISTDDNGDLSLPVLLAKQPDTFIDEFVAMEDTALITFTSGTTGRPKGVMLSHKNLSWNVFNLLSCTDYLSDDIILVNAPLHRMGALGVTVLPGLYKGAALVLHGDEDIRTTAELISRQKISVLFNGPGFYQLLDEFAQSKKTDFSSIRFCIIGGDIIPPALVKRWLDRGIQFQQGYGLTEAAPVALFLDKEELLSKNGSAGRPVFFTDIRVVKSDMSDAQPGQSGEIILKGPNITPGYWENPQLTKQKITHNGWLHSGDAARVDYDGHFYILGRIKDGMLIDDTLVYPAEIEKVAGEQPEIAECAVIGIPEEDSVRIILFAVLKNGQTLSEEDILAALDGKVANGYLPDAVIFVESLPKNANGKVIRDRLKELLVTDSLKIDK